MWKIIAACKHAGIQMLKNYASTLVFVKNKREQDWIAFTRASFMEDRTIYDNISTNYFRNFSEPSRLVIQNSFSRSSSHWITPPFCPTSSTASMVLSDSALFASSSSSKISVTISYPSTVSISPLSIILRSILCSITDFSLILSSSSTSQCLFSLRII